MLETDGLSIQLQRKKIKNMYLRVLPPDGRVCISAPVGMSEQVIKAFALSKREWILQQQEKIEEKLREDSWNQNVEPMRIVTGDTLYLWGRALTLTVKYLQPINQVIHMEEELLLMLRTTKLETTTDERMDILNKWYRQMLMKELPNYIQKWEQIIGVKSSSFTVRDMKTRWGSCNIRTGKICFNLQLVKKAPESLEYVVVHELVHLLEGSHNHIFKGYMSSFLPDWKERKNRLNL